MTPAERLAVAKAGEVFTFAADEPLGHVRLPARVADITIRGGVLSSMAASGNLGLRLEGVGLAFQTPEGVYDGPWLGSFRQCADFVWEGGALIGRTRADGTREGQACYLTDCDRATLRGLTVEGFRGGLQLIGGRDHLVETCEVRGVRGSPIRFITAGGTRVVRNFVHSPQPESYGGQGARGSAGDHGNLISGRPIGEAPDVVIEGNSCVVGLGLPSFCGIDMKQDSTPALVHWFVKPLIHGNLVSTSHGYGIRIQQTMGGLIENNQLHWARTGPEDAAGPRCHVWSPVRRDADGGRLVVRESGQVVPFKLTAEDLAALDAG